MNTVPMSWSEVFNGAQTLAQRIKKEVQPIFPCYTLIGRGGLAMGAILVRFLEMESVVYLPLSRYPNKYLQDVTPYRRKHVAALEAASHVFLVDDIYDQGLTIEHVATNFLTKGSVKRVVAVTLLKKSPNKFRQGEHLFWKEINQGWTIFPWEVHDELPHTLKEEKK